MSSSNAYILYMWVVLCVYLFVAYACRHLWVGDYFFFFCVCVFFILFHCYCCYSYQVVCSYLCTALRGCTNVQTRFVCSIYLSFYPSIHPSIHPSVHLSIYLSMSVSVVSCQHGNCTHRMYSVRVHARGNISWSQVDCERKIEQKQSTRKEEERVHTEERKKKCSMKKRDKTMQKERKGLSSYGITPAFVLVEV